MVMGIPDLSGAPHPIGLLVVAGSKAYGLDTATSDTDYRGFFVAPTEQILGVHRTADSWVSNDPDLSAHEVGKFVDLALQANPTDLEILSIDSPLVSSPLAEDLRANADAFWSNQAKARFRGYAASQFRRAMNRPHGPFSSVTRKRTAKHARHLLRLLQQGRHLLEHGEMRVRVPNRDEIFAFGDLPLDERAEAAEDEFVRYDEIVSVLPDEPDVERVNEILVRHRIAGLVL